MSSWCIDNGTLQSNGNKYLTNKCIKKDEYREFMVDPKKKKGSGRRMSLYHPTYVKLKNSTTISGNMSYKWKL